jgi:transposase
MKKLSDKKQQEKKVEEALKKAHEAPKTQQTPIDLREATKKLFENRYKEEELLVVGDAVKLMKSSDLWPILCGAIDYVVSAELDKDTKVGDNSDKSLGIQIGARRVLTTIIGIETRAIIKNLEIEKKRAQEESEEEADNEDNTPGKKDKGRGNVGIQ